MTDPLFTPADLGLPSSRFPSYRPGQLETVMDLAASPHRFNLLSAPTGAGKTAIYMSVPALLGDGSYPARTLVLTGTKTLQHQIYGDFRRPPTRASDIYGHSNYPCAEPRKGARERYDPDRCSAPSPDRCSYKVSCSIAANSRFVIGNYAHWITLSLYSNPILLGAFDLLVLDEAHTALDWVTNMLSVRLSRYHVRDLIDRRLPPLSSTHDEWLGWGREALVATQERLSEVQEAVSSGSSLPSGLGLSSTQYLVRQLTGLANDLKRLVATENDETRWVVQEDGDEQTYSPVWPHEYTERHLFRAIPHVILASANIRPGDCKDLGIDAERAGYFEGRSIFDARRRPLIWLDMRPKVRVDSRATDTELLTAVRRIDQVISGRLDRKGVVHTRSYRLAKFLLANTRHARLMLSHTSRDAKQVIAKFKEASAPSILVSPAVEEGHDFPGDECRYQVLMKVPFLYAGDPLTKARTETDPGFSMRVTARDLIQMTGRGMRAADDWCENFIVDDHWRWFRKEAGLFPKWHLQSWRVMKTIPVAPPLNR